MFSDLNYRQILSPYLSSPHHTTIISPDGGADDGRVNVRIKRLSRCLSQIPTPATLEVLPALYFSSAASTSTDRQTHRTRRANPSCLYYYLKSPSPHLSLPQDIAIKANDATPRLRGTHELRPRCWTDAVVFPVLMFGYAGGIVIVSSLKCSCYVREKRGGLYRARWDLRVEVLPDALLAGEKRSVPERATVVEWLGSCQDDERRRVLSVTTVLLQYPLVRSKYMPSPSRGTQHQNRKFIYPMRADPSSGSVITPRLKIRSLATENDRLTRLLSSQPTDSNPSTPHTPVRPLCLHTSPTLPSHPSKSSPTHFDSHSNLLSSSS